MARQDFMPVENAENRRNYHSTNRMRSDVYVMTARYAELARRT